jgi:hypothetical protein
MKSLATLCGDGRRANQFKANIQREDFSYVEPYAADTAS